MSIHKSTHLSKRHLTKRFGDFLSRCRPSGLLPFMCISFLLQGLALANLWFSSHGYVDSIAPLAPQAVQDYKLCVF